MIENIMLTYVVSDGAFPSLFCVWQPPPAHIPHIPCAISFVDKNSLKNVSKIYTSFLHATIIHAGAFVFPYYIILKYFP